MVADDHFMVTERLLMDRIESLGYSGMAYETVNEEILASRIAKLSEETDVFAVANDRIRHYSNLLKQLKYTEEEIDRCTDIYHHKIVRLISNALKGQIGRICLDTGSDFRVIAN